MSQELPPGLRPQLQPPSRATAIALARAKLDELDAAGVEDAFMLHAYESDGLISTIGCANQAGVQQIALAALNNVVLDARQRGQEHLRLTAELAISMLGGKIVTVMGGPRPIKPT